MARLTPKLRCRPFAVVGTVAQIIETFKSAEALGFSYVIVGTGDVEPFAPVVAALTGK